MKRACASLSLVVLCATAALPAGVAPAADPPRLPAPQLLRFEAGDRIKTGRVARYDLREESRAFSYRIRAQYLEAKVEKRKGSRWVWIGRVRASPPRPPDFWPVFRKIGLGSYRVVARAYNGTGKNRRASRYLSVRFTVVAHIPHTD